MEEKELALISRFFDKKLDSLAAKGKGRLFLSAIRQMGDDMGEPVFPADEHTPKHFVRVSIRSPYRGGDRMVIAMTPEAAAKILSRC